MPRKIFCCRPRVCKVCFFCCAPLGAATFRRGQSQKKKNTTQGVFFFCSGPGERQGKEKPRWAPARGQSKKKTPPRVFFFCCGPGERQGSRHGARTKKKTPPRVLFFCSGPGERQGKEKPRWAPARGQSKKCFFFCSGPVPAPNGASPSPAVPGAGAKKNTLGGVFFLLWPRAGAQRGFSFPCLSPGPQQKKTPWVVFFFCSGPVPAPNGASPSRAFRRGRSKKKIPWVVFFFFAAAPRGRSLTHCGPGWRCLLLGGVVFFFLLRSRPDRGGVFFFAVAPPGRSLTHGGLGRFRQGPGGVFFCCGPAGSF